MMEDADLVSDDSPPSPGQAMLDSLPLCMITLDPVSFHPIAANAMFEARMGPLYKYAGGDFVQHCSADEASDERDECSSFGSGSVGGSSRDRLLAALGEIQLGRGEEQRIRLRGIEMMTVSDRNQGFPIRRQFDWFVSMHTSSSTTNQIVLLGDPCSDQDVSERHKEAELIDFFQNAPIALHWLTGDGRVLWANQTELNVLGYTAEEYIGQPIMKFCPDEEELVLEIFKQLGSGNAIRDVPVRFRTKDGKIVHLLIDSNVKYNKDGSFGHTRCFIRDDTGRKIRQARAELMLSETKRSLKQLDNFMARTLHHMRAPLQMTQNIVDTLSTRLMASNDHDRNIVGMATDHISSSLQLLDDIGDLEKFDQGMMLNTQPEPTSLSAFGQAFLNQANPLPKPGVKFKLQLAPQKEKILFSQHPGPDQAMIDQKVLYRILNSLYTSAIDTTEKGSIVLRIGYGRNKLLTFALSDTGPGLEMPPNAAAGDLPVIFQRYQQELLPEENMVDMDHATSINRRVEESISSCHKQQIGVGLSLSYHLVHSLGGELRCASAMGQGTTFWFSVPASVSYNAVIRSEFILEPANLARMAPLQPTQSPPLSVVSTISDTSPIQQQQQVPMVTSSGIPPMVTSSGIPPSIDIVLEDDRASKRKRVFAKPEEEVPQHTSEMLASCGVKSQNPASILVVEDTASCAKLICMMLTKLRCSFRVARNGQEALDILYAATPGLYDLILMDLRMPVMDGLEATRIIKTQMGLSTPVMALTADDSEETREECNKIGFDKFYTKPVKQTMLKQMILQISGQAS